MHWTAFEISLAVVTLKGFSLLKLRYCKATLTKPAVHV